MIQGREEPRRVSGTVVAPCSWSTEALMGKSKRAGELAGPGRVGRRVPRTLRNTEAEVRL